MLWQLAFSFQLKMCALQSVKSCIFAGFQNFDIKISRLPCSDIHDSRLAGLENDFPNYLTNWYRNAKVQCAELGVDGTSTGSPMLLSRSTEEGSRINVHFFRCRLL